VVRGGYLFFFPAFFLALPFLPFFAAFRAGLRAFALPRPALARAFLGLRAAFLRAGLRAAGTAGSLSIAVGRGGSGGGITGSVSCRVAPPPGTEAPPPAPPPPPPPSTP